MLHYAVVDNTKLRSYAKKNELAGVHKTFIRIAFAEPG